MHCFKDLFLARCILKARLSGAYVQKNTVTLFVCPENNSEPQPVATAPLCSIRVTEDYLLRRHLHGTKRPEDGQSDLGVIRNVSVRQEGELVFYLYMYQAKDDIPDLMYNIFSASFYDGETRAMQLTTNISTVAARSESEP